MSESKKVQAWLFNTNVAKKITVIEVAELQKSFEGRLEIVKRNNGNFAMYATNKKDRIKLKNRMNTYVPKPTCHEVFPGNL
jgi:hypothetical protein